MNLVIDFIDDQKKLQEAEIAEVKNLLQFAAEKEGIEENTEVSVTITSNVEIQEINRQYRGKNSPTDVISFAMEEMGEGETEIIGVNQPRVLGDIIISAEKALEQAEEYQHSFARELGFLAVHGLLHLLGYDHETEADEKQMFSRQREILDEFGLER